MSEENNEPKGYQIEAIAGLNPRGEGFIHLRIEYPDQPAGVTQMTPAKAREVAQFINEAAEAAESDAFLYQFLTRQVDSDPGPALQVIAEFRKWRETSGGVKARNREDPHFLEMKRRNEERDRRPPPADPKKQ
jgi:hypothetical protein